MAALTFLAANVKGLSKLPAAKLLYFADKYHLTRYGRPVIGDQYVKMEYGPVPSKALDWMNDLITPFRVKGYPRPGLDLLQRFLTVEKEGASHPIFKARRDPD
ncbi:MAG: Panacea domain-containing protein [Acidobacteriota bacterium]